MDNPAIPLKVKLLWKASKPADFDLYKAALEWSLVDPIIIENRDDLKSEYLWRDKIKPYHHQVTNLITFCRRLPVTLLADDVGLGKTISAGLIASELMTRDRVSKILIVCPKLLMNQWSEELEQKFGIASTTAIGKTLIKAKPPKDVGAVITTYTSAKLYLDDLEDAGYQMLILDEAHKLRNLYGVDPTPQVATRFRKALKDRLFRYVLMLTATPIQNRLWDLYSLIDLLTVARGHENPFGSEGIFARKFIDDDRTQARRLNLGAKDEFRSIIYQYMSRVRRGDAQLYFPERKVLLKSVAPTAEESELIGIIAEPIQELNRLGQISVLQALISSPDALAAQLRTMARNETIPAELATRVREVVKKMKTTAKMQGLGSLVEKLRKERPEDWRMVVFTTRRETQTTIQAFLEGQGIACGVINGDSGRRNQETINNFKCYPPQINVIISTEAGSEGVNLQAANVLVNYDLPWNPMVVEQRIGRIQRLASEHKTVSIFNIILKGTFEEYIVGRLMEKLQMASQAIGDVESLLQASGMEEGEGEITSFEEQIRRLVIESLAGKDVEEATRMAEKSIEHAEAELDREEKNIDSMLGGMGDVVGVDPYPPKLTPVNHSMGLREFVLGALEAQGEKVTAQPNGLYVSESHGQKELFRFDNEVADPETTSTLYAPGSPAFERLVNRCTSRGYHTVNDVDIEPLKKAMDIAGGWAKAFDGRFDSAAPLAVYRNFEGSAIIRVHATVAHDSYERLVESDCAIKMDHDLGKLGLEPLHASISDPHKVGLDTDCLIDKAFHDPDISEFCRFYGERLEQELKAVGDDERKRKKTVDDFTPRIAVELVGLNGNIHRRIKLNTKYRIDEGEYESSLTVIPNSEEVIEAPEIKKCEKTGRHAPADCFGICEISKLQVLRHLLVASDISDRQALPEHVIKCSYSGKKVLIDEAAKSDISGHFVTASLLLTSAISGKKGEPTYFGQCEFTSVTALKDELLTSEVSGKLYRSDEQLRSTVSGKSGHRQEFIKCAVTSQPLLREEAEQCEVTGTLVAPGILEECSVTKKKVLPSELAKSEFSGKMALQKYFVSSSISDGKILESEAVRSSKGKYCSPAEVKPCAWSGLKYHPDDLEICHLSGLSVHSVYVTPDGPPRITSLARLLDGTLRKADGTEYWQKIVDALAGSVGGVLKVDAAEFSPDGTLLAVCLESTKWLVKTRYLGLVFSLRQNSATGRIVSGKRKDHRWIDDLVI